MHELEALLGRLKMEHLRYQVESLLEQAAKEELNYREFLCSALQTRMERPPSARDGVAA
ncbi:hypothetical protein [Serratia symbiotica]|uniref:hypothetical protein n=1 Tax=Serratia symbiotica TaxID=138074 RepID=UPI000A7F6DBB|nr:hypothetical protein [Serratia symbiotica]